MSEAVPVINNTKPVVAAIIGPTGIGKTRLAIELALKNNGEIINADSRQVYRYMDIGTAKPSKEELSAVPHHLIDIIEPNDDFSLAQYQKLAYQTIANIQKRGKLPFLVGGTGQYIWGVLEGWVIPAVVPDNAYRQFLEQQVADGKTDELVALLQKLDPVSAEKIDAHNVRRVIRALEVIHKTDKPFSGQRTKNPPPFESQIIGLTMERKALYAQTDARVYTMIAQGFVEEVKGLLAKGYPSSLPSMSSIGYREIALYLKGEITLQEAVEKMKIGTHRFIRHQYAWFRLKDERIRWVEAEKV
jgi:tRNA dimethylallyltransferase